MTLISEFLFSTKRQLILGQNISSPPLKNKWSPHHVFTLHAMRNSKKSKWQKPQKTIFRHCNIHAQVHSITPQAPSETFPPTSFLIPPLCINFLLGGGIHVLWKHFFQLFNFRRHAIRLSCLSFKTAKCWIQTSPLNRLCLSHIKPNLAEGSAQELRNYS